MLHDLLFWTGNAIAIVGGFMALAWVTTSTRFYWRRRRRGMAALVFIVVGVALMAEGHSRGAVHQGSVAPAMDTMTAQSAGGGARTIGRG